MLCEQCNKKMYEFINELGSDMSSIEKTMKQCDNVLRYLELKSAYDSLRITRNKLSDKFDLN